MRTLNFLSKPTIARVNGAAYGGGVGLVACCDIAIASDSAKFALTEVKLGLVPAVISPYVIAAIGARHARRLFVTGEIFDASEAARIGLVHRRVRRGELDAAVDDALDCARQGWPACAVAKPSSSRSHRRHDEAKCRTRRRGKCSTDRATARLGRGPGRARRVSRQAQAELELKE